MKVFSRVLTTIDYPGAQSTQLTGINRAGVIVGITDDGKGATQGFLYTRGTFQAVPLPPVPAGQPTCQLGGINEAGCIVGSRIDEHNGVRAFVLTPSGSGGTYTWADLALPIAGATKSNANGINEAGDIVGAYAEGGGWYGFVLHPGGGAASFTAPHPGTKWTSGLAINNSGAIVGVSWNEDAAAHLEAHGFLFSGGTFTPLDYPGATWVCPTGINAAGDIVGGYWVAEWLWHGFLWHAGQFTPFDLPGALYTDPRGINDAGSIVGTYMDTQSRLHGFLSQRVAVSVPFPREERLRVPIHVFPWWAESRSEGRGV